MWKVANAVREGLTEFTSDQIEKGNFVAVYAADERDNHGMPFWIGKVVDVLLHEDSDVEDGESGDDDHETYDIKIAEYHQANSTASGKYEPTMVAGKKAKRGSKRAPASKVTSVIPLAQICHVFQSLTQGKTIPAEEKSWIAFNCEVAARNRAFDLSTRAVKEFNDSCGFKTMPFT